MKKRGFSLVEQLVGLGVGVFLISGMASFLGSASHSFQGNKTLVQDRSELLRGFSVISRDLMGIGLGATADGMTQNEAEPEFFVSFSKTEKALSTTLSYWVVTSDMDALANADPTKPGYSWQQITYTVDADAVDPYTGDTINLLRRNGDPFILGVTEFSVVLGVDANDDGTVSEEEWVSEPPADDAEAKAMYGALRMVRISLSKQSLNGDGDEYESHMEQNINLRNRGVL